MARWVADSSLSRVRTINILALDPVPGELGVPQYLANTIGRLGSGAVLPPEVKRYVGIYAADERSYKFEPLIPDRESTGATKAWMFTVRGTHETMIGNPEIDGFSDHILGIGSAWDTRLLSVSRLTLAVAKELLGSQSWGEVQFENSPWFEGANPSSLEDLVDQMYAYPDYDVMHGYAYPFGWSIYDAIWELAYPGDYLLLGSPIPLGLDRFCYVAPIKGLGWPLNGERVFLLKELVGPVERHSIRTLINWING
jgi:hypothetical protein